MILLLVSTSMTFTATATVNFAHFSCNRSMDTVTTTKTNGKKLLLRVHSLIFTFKRQRVKLLPITVNIKLNPTYYTQGFKGGKCG